MQDNAGLMPFALLNKLRALGRRPSAAVHAPLLDDAALAALIRRVEALRLAAPHRREVQQRQAGDLRSRYLGRGLDFEEVRPYQRGDDVRDMDWRTTARTGRPYLKTFRQEHQPALSIVLDRGASMRFGTRGRLKAAQAASLAAMFAVGAAGGNTCVGGTVWQPGGRMLPCRSGERGAMELVRAAIAPCPPLERAQQEQAWPFAEMLRQVDELSPRGSRLVLISDLRHLGEGDLPLLARLAERHQLIVVQVLDRAEEALPDVGLARFQDAAGGGIRWIDTGSGAVRDAFRDRADALHRAQEAWFRRLAVPFYRCTADADPFPVFQQAAGHG